MTEPKLLSTEELEDALLVVAGDASYGSFVWHAEEKIRAHISALEAERDEAREALIEAHNCIVKARDLLQSSEALAPGAISRDAFRRTQDVFEQMQKAIAAIRSELLANGGRDE